MPTGPLQQRSRYSAGYIYTTRTSPTDITPLRPRCLCWTRTRLDDDGRMMIMMMDTIRPPSLELGVLTIFFFLHRFSPLIFSTLPRLPRLRSTSSRYASRNLRTDIQATKPNENGRILCPPPGRSSWMSSAPAASQSPPSSPTPRPSSSARAAPPFCANLQVVRPD